MAKTSVDSALVPCASSTIVAVPGFAATAAARDSDESSGATMGANGSLHAASVSAPMASVRRRGVVRMGSSVEREAGDPDRPGRAAEANADLNGVWGAPVPWPTTRQGPTHASGRAAATAECAVLLVAHVLEPLHHLAVEL